MGKEVKEQEYKETPIGRIPEEWEVVRLEDKVKLRNGERPTFSKNGQYPVYGANGIMGYSDESITTKDYTIVIGRVGASGEIHLAKGKVLVSDNAIYSEEYNTQEIYLPFLFYLLKSKNLKSFATKTTHPIITQTFLKNFLISLPKKMEEQRRIAEILSTVDEAIQQVDEAISRTERLKRGLMRELLTKGIGHEEFKDTEIGRIPKEWEVVRLGNVSELIRNGLTYRQNKKGIGYPTSRIETISDGVIDPSKLGYIESLSDREIEEYRLKAGDILFSHINSIEHFAKTAIYSGAPSFLIHGMNLLLLRPMKKKIAPMFLAHYLKYENTRNKFRSWAKRAVNQVSLKQTELKRFKLSLPPFPEQCRIAEILSSLDKKLILERKRKEKLERIKQGLMNDLLTGRKRVRVAA